MGSRTRPQLLVNIFCEINGKIFNFGSMNFHVVPHTKEIGWRNLEFEGEIEDCKKFGGLRNVLKIWDQQ